MVCGWVGVWVGEWVCMCVRVCVRARVCVSRRVRARVLTRARKENVRHLEELNGRPADSREDSSCSLKHCRLARRVHTAQTMQSSPRASAWACVFARRKGGARGDGMGGRDARSAWRVLRRSNEESAPEFLRTTAAPSLRISANDVRAVA